MAVEVLASWQMDVFPESFIHVVGCLEVLSTADVCIQLLFWHIFLKSCLDLGCHNKARQQTMNNWLQTTPMISKPWVSV